MHFRIKFLLFNDLPLKVMCGVNFLFYFVHHINVYVGLSELNGHLVFAREG